MFSTSSTFSGGTLKLIILARTIPRSPSCGLRRFFLPPLLILPYPCRVSLSIGCYFKTLAGGVLVSWFGRLAGTRRDVPAAHARSSASQVPSPNDPTSQGSSARSRPGLPGPSPAAPPRKRPQRVAVSFYVLMELLSYCDRPTPYGSRTVFSRPLFDG